MNHFASLRRWLRNSAALPFVKGERDAKRGAEHWRTLQPDRWRKNSGLLWVRLFLVLAIPLLISPFRSASKPFEPLQEVTSPEAGEEPTPNYAWAPALLYDVISSHNPDALNYLYDSVFATGPSMTPQLVDALKDDRTAEFAAQALAFLGGEEALTALSKLVNDPRDLNLRRFYYGALGEFDTPQANQILVNVIRNANHEPDRTVTEAAIIALTVHSNTGLAPSLKQAEVRLTDPVIQDDLENALSIIQSRARYLATSAGKSAGGSILQAVRAYFMPALEGDAGIEAASEHATTSDSKTQAHATHRSAPPAKIEIELLVFSPDKNRALAHVVFKEPGAIAHYKIVLQKRYGDWTLASVWLGREEERMGLGGTP
jgi:hypothetical protein